MLVVGILPVAHVEVKGSVTGSGAVCPEVESTGKGLTSRSPCNIKLAKVSENNINLTFLKWKNDKGRGLSFIDVRDTTHFEY